MARLRSKTGIAQFQHATPYTPEAAVRRPAHNTGAEVPRRRDVRAGPRVNDRRHDTDGARRGTQRMRMLDGCMAAVSENPVAPDAGSRRTGSRRPPALP